MKKSAPSPAPSVRDSKILEAKEEKKAKNFLDQRLKPKARAKSLWMYLDATNNFDQARFFQEHAEQVFYVVYETCMYQVEKIKGKTERSTAWNSKEIGSLTRTLYLLRKIFLYLPELVRNGWENKKIATILSHILDHGNQPRLRMLGFRLLLYWLNDHATEYPEAMNLFKNAVSLDLFLMDELRPLNEPTTSGNPEEKDDRVVSWGKESFVRDSNMFANVREQRRGSRGSVKSLGGPGIEIKALHSKEHFNQEFISADDRPPILPNPNPPTVTESIALFQIFIFNLVRLAYVAAGSTPPSDEYELPGENVEPDDGIATGVGIDAAYASAKFMFQILRKYYLVKVFPNIARAMSMDGSKDGVGFPRCPIAILRIILTFLIRYCLDKSENIATLPMSNSSFSNSSPATPILKSIVFSTKENRELLHEVLHQCFVLSPTNPGCRDIVRGAVHIVGVWLLSGEQERPSFLRRSIPFASQNSTGSTISLPLPGIQSFTEEDFLKRSPSPQSFYSIPGSISSSITAVDRGSFNGANIFLRRYFRLLKIVFEDHTPESLSMPASPTIITNSPTSATAISPTSQFFTANDLESVAGLYKDIISLYRSIMTVGPIEIDNETWETLLTCLMDILDRVMSQANKDTSPVTKFPDETMEYIVEICAVTTMYAFVRSRTTNAELWVRFKGLMSIGTQWGQVVHHWVRIVMKLTRILSVHLYQVDIETLNLIHPPRRGRDQNQSKNSVKPRTRHISIHGDYSHHRHSRHINNISGNPDTQRASSPGPSSVLDTSSLALAGESLKQKPIYSDRIARRTMSMHIQDLGTNSLRSSVGESRLSSSTTGITGQSNTIDDSSGDSEIEGDVSGPGQGGTTMEVTRTSGLGGGGNIGERNPLEDSGKSNRASMANTISSILPGEAASNLGMSSINEKLPSTLATFRTSDFTNLTINMQWDGTTALSMWKNMLTALGNINMIQNPAYHSTAMNCVVDAWDMLSFVRSRQHWQGVPIPALYDMAPWFFQATELPASFAVGRALAYGCLCRMMCRKPTHLLPQEYCSHFYQVVAKGLASTDENIVHAIIINSTPLFSMCLPGCNVLIPSYLESIGRVLHDEAHYSVTEELRKSCITILASLLSLSNHLDELSVPLIPGELKPDHGEPDEFEFLKIKVMLKDLLLSLISLESNAMKTDKFSDTHSMLINCITDLVLDELIASRSPDQTLIMDCLRSLLGHVYWSNLTVVNTVVDCLNTLALNYREESDPDLAIIQEVFSRLLDALNAHLKLQKLQQDGSKTGRGCIVAKLFYCLLEWLMTIPPRILTDTELCQLVFDAIEFALNLTSDEEKIPPYLPSRRKERRLRDMRLKFRVDAERRVGVHFDHSHNLADFETNVDEDYVKEAADSVLLHLMHHFGNFPPPYGLAMMSTLSVGPGFSDEKLDDQYEQYQYYAFNDTTLLCLVEQNVQDPRDSQARLIIRDVTGRYGWNAQLFYGTLVPNASAIVSAETELSSPARDSMQFNMADELLVRDGVTVKESKDSSIDEQLPKNYNGQTFSVLPTWQGDEYTEQVDVLNQLLQYIGETSPDCLLLPNTPLNAPPPLSANEESIVVDLDKRLNRHITEELANSVNIESVVLQHLKEVSNWRSSLPNSNPSRVRYSGSPVLSPQVPLTRMAAQFSLSKAFIPVMPSFSEPPGASYQQCRLLLSHFGFLNYDFWKEGSFYMLNKTSSLFRDIKGLDKRPYRETMKIAVIYVGPGQEDEQSILQNAKGSPIFEQFVSSLGWEIDVATHPGYLGGLERNLATGSKATYFCNSTVEMIFHDVTKMPTDPLDPQQVKKKRHVGNDHVHIVWNQHHRDYKPQTIGGDFGNAQIIVAPLPNGLFSIRIHRDSKVRLFGPLLDGMVVSQEVLGPLVRATAMHAYRATGPQNVNGIMSRHVYHHRMADINQIVQRHKAQKCSFETFMSRVFGSNS